VAAFAGNPDVSFGDINLSEQPIKGVHKPGDGGWPTIRYFNKETGVDGGSYKQKTDKMICDELKADAAMQAYVEEYGKTSLCSVVTGAGCSDKAKEYIAKMKNAGNTAIADQLKRLESMDGSTMKSELRDWLNVRVAILRQFIKISSNTEL